jgi:hypothetical protein
MINPALYGKPVALDTAAHRSLKVGTPMADWSVAAKLNAIFVAAIEFRDVAAEYPIVFVNAGTSPEGKREIAPVAVFGLGPQENLFVQGTAWRARYQPALLRAYPFGIARTDDKRVVIVIDEAWPGWSQTEGQALFNADGKPTEHMAALREHLEKVEAEVQRTRYFGQALAEADLLVDMRFDATLPGGQVVTVDGFLIVDEKKLAALPDAKVLEFHRNGVLALVLAQQMSLRHMQQLVQWRVERQAAV